MKPLVLIAAQILLQACDSNSAENKIVMPESLQAAHVDYCARNVDESKFRECIFREKKNRTISISIGPGLPGLPGADIFVPDAVSVLRSIVERCELGMAFLEYATDGQATLWIGNPGLTPNQVGCIHSMERPGLRLREAN